MISLVIPATVIQTTLNHLKLAGQRGSECVVLWLGRRSGEDLVVTAAWRPEQRAGRDFFEIPRQSLELLFEHLRPTRGLVIAQVHTHPGRAFHSRADDEWAIVRHAGALSLVVPYFGRNTNSERFFRDAAIFALTPANEWESLSLDQINLCLTQPDER